jgi:hypothetical protein
MGVKPKTKVVLRKLPPNLTEEDLLQVPTYMFLCSFLSALCSLLSALYSLLPTTYYPLLAIVTDDCSRLSRRGRMTTTGFITTGARGGRERSGRV